MDVGTLAAWLVVAIVAIAVGAFVWARRPRGSARIPPPGTPPATDEDNYLDSSHISGPIVRPRPPGGDATGSDRR